MQLRNHEREAVETRLSQIIEELALGKLTSNQRAALIRQQLSLMSARWEMLACQQPDADEPASRPR